MYQIRRITPKREPRRISFSVVIPAKTGIHLAVAKGKMDSGLRRNDEIRELIEAPKRCFRRPGALPLRLQWTIIIIFLLELLGSTQAAGRAPVTSLLEMRRDHVIVQEWDLSCGAAALATILRYQHGDSVSEREIATSLMQRKEYIAHPLLVRIRQGFSLLDLKRYVDQRGYEGIGYGKLTFQDLLEQAPIMVPLNLYGYNHFVVFRGARRNQVLLADPAWGNRTMGIERFKHAWISYPQIGKVGFVVVQHDGSSAPANGLAPRPKDFVMF